MATEIEGIRVLEQVGGKGHWQGVRTFITYEGNTASECRDLWDTAWPGIAGDNAPVCKRTKATWHPNGLKGLVKIHAYYESPRQAGKARIVTTTRSAMRKVFQDRDAEVIEGPDATYDWAVWQVVRGDNHIEDYQTIIRLETAYPTDQYEIKGPLSLEGAVNTDTLTLPGFGMCDAGSLRCLGVLTNQEYGAKMVDITYLLVWSGLGPKWNDVLMSQLGHWGVDRVPVFDGDTLVRTKAGYIRTRDVVAWKPGLMLAATGTETIADGTSTTVYERQATSPEHRRLYWNTAFGPHMAGLTSW